MHGHNGRDLDVGDAEDLVGLVGRPPDRAQGRDKQVAAVPEHPVGVEQQPAPVLLGVDDQHPAGTDDQVIDVGWRAGDGQVVQDRPAVALQGSEQAGGAPLPCGAAPPGSAVGAGAKPQLPAQPSPATAATTARGVR